MPSPPTASLLVSEDAPTPSRRRRARSAQGVSGDGSVHKELDGEVAAHGHLPPKRKPIVGLVGADFAGGALREPEGEAEVVKSSALGRRPSVSSVGGDFSEVVTNPQAWRFSSLARGSSSLFSS